MFEICEKKDCTACYACINACPHNCITMAEDGDRALYPVIDRSECIDCGRCERVCPARNEISKNQIQNTYAAYAKDSATHEASTSGGIVFELCRAFIEDGGTVYASAMDTQLNTAVIRCDSIKALKRTQGSKYVHSHVNLAMRDIKKDLDSGQRVLFVGTPCQVAGLRGFLGANNELLTTADIICHGVPAQAVFFSHAKAILKQDFATADAAAFRRGNDYALTFYQGKTLLHSLPWRADTYLTAFLEGNSFRENCYHCRYAGEARVSDMTLGDFWGIKEEDFDQKILKTGLNAVLVNTAQGAALWARIQGCVNAQERPTEEAVRGNDQLRHPCKESSDARRFRTLCATMPPAEALRAYRKRHALLCDARRMVYRITPLYKLLSHIPKIKERI